MPAFSADNTIHWTPSDAILPMQSTRRGSRIGGVCVSLFSLAWCGFLIFSIVAGTLQEGVNVPMTLLLLVFTLAGLLFLWMGLNMLFGRREVFIDRQQVTVRDRGLRRTRSWVEPLAAYAGVLRRVVRHSGGRSGTSWTHWLVVLAHESPNREIQLFDSRGGSDVLELQTEAWRRLGGLLGRPLLEENAEGVFEVSAADRDVPLFQRLGVEDPVAPAVALASDLGGRVKVTRDGIATVFAHRRFRNCWKGALALGVTLAMIAVARHIEATGPNADGIWIFIWVMYGFAAMFALAFVTELVGHEELRVDHDRVVHRRRHGLAIHEEWLELQEIRAVSVKRDERVASGSQAVVIEGANTTIRFCESLPRAILIALKGQVLALLGENAPSLRRVVPQSVKVAEAFQAGRALLVWVPIVMLAFFSALGTLMYIAFDSESMATGAASVSPTLEEHAQRRRLDTPRNALIGNWQRHYRAAEEAVRNQDYALAEREFRAALIHAKQLGPDEPMLASTADYLDWVLKR